MALYLGDNKIKVNINGKICGLKLSLDASSFESVRLLSFDQYVLKDSNGIYLMTIGGNNYNDRV